MLHAPSSRETRTLRGFRAGWMLSSTRLRAIPRRLVALATFSVLVPALGACSSSEDPSASPARVLIVAVESMGWERVDHLLARGELPNLGRLIREGTRAVVVAPDPLDAPMLWTTAFTGKSPRQHQVTGELAYLPDGTRTLVPSAMRPNKSLLQIVGDEGKPVVSVGIPVTWPAEVINGFLVAPGAVPSRWTLTEEHTARRAPSDLATFPTGLFAEIEHLLRDPLSIRREEAARFFTLNEFEYSMLFDRPLGSIYKKTNPLRDFAVTHQRDLSYVDVTLDLMKRYEPRLVTVHIELLEAIQPVYWPFAYPDHYSTPSDSRRRFAGTIDATHRFVDEQIGRLVDALPPRSTVIVVSERGFGNGSRETEEGSRAVATHMNEAVMIVWGQGIEPAKRLGRVQLADLTPTVLRIFGVPVGGDMDGSVLVGALRPEFAATHPRRTIESHDTNWDQTKRYPREMIAPPDAQAPDSETMERP